MYPPPPFVVTATLDLPQATCTPLLSNANSSREKPAISSYSVCQYIRKDTKYTIHSKWKLWVGTDSILYHAWESPLIRKLLSTKLDEFKQTLLSTTLFTFQCWLCFCCWVYEGNIPYFRCYYCNGCILHHTHFAVWCEVCDKDVWWGLSWVLRVRIRTMN